MGLSKYLKAFKNSKEILEGIKNNIFKQEHIEAEAEARFDICKQCTALDREGLHCLMSGTEPCCAECGCSLELKTRSLSSECPRGKWPAIMTEDEEDLLIEKLDDDE